MSRYAEDLTGQQFNCWTVLGKSQNVRKTEKRNKSRWICRCKCGYIKDIDSWTLKKGKSKQCTICGKRTLEDLTGRKFGEWTVLKLSSKPRHWWVECSCGKKATIRGDNLKDGFTKRCKKCRGSYWQKIESGTKINKLTILANIKKYNRAYCRCKCECGKITEVRTDSIKIGTVKGCRSCSRAKILHKEIYSSFWNRIIKCAVERGIEFNITVEYAWKLFEKQNRKCALTGVIIYFGLVGNGKGIYEQTASLDRIDSTKGYIEGNIQWVHKRVNIIKQDQNQDDFIDMCVLISQNFPRKIDPIKYHFPCQMRL